MQWQIVTDQTSMYSNDLAQLLKTISDRKSRQFVPDIPQIQDRYFFQTCMSKVIYIDLTFVLPLSG